jgi:hypothetical protein
MTTPLESALLARRPVSTRPLGPSARSSRLSSSRPLMDRSAPAGSRGFAQSQQCPTSTDKACRRSPRSNDRMPDPGDELLIRFGWAPADARAVNSGRSWLPTTVSTGPGSIVKARASLSWSRRARGVRSPSTTTEVEPAIPNIRVQGLDTGVKVSTEVWVRQTDDYAHPPMIASGR